MSTERDPPRLSQGGEGVPPALLGALGAARARLPGEALLSAVAARLPPGPSGGPGGRDPSGGGAAGQATSGSPTGGIGSGAGSPVPGASVPIAAAPSVWSGVFFGAALGALVGGGSLLLPASAPAPGLHAAAASAPVSAAATGHHAPANPPVPAASPDPGRPVSPSSGASPTAALASGGSSPDSTAPAPADSAPPASQDSPSASPAEAEADYLRRAHAQISSSPAQALSLAEAHPLRYPDGKLGQEREMIVIGALAALGRTSEAESRARAFIARFPDSAHRRRLEVMVPSLAEPAR